MINPFFALSGIGMMLVGLVPILYWRYRTLVPWRDFWSGALIWAVAILIKIFLDITVTPFFVNVLSGIYTAAGIALITGMYVGLRTGFFESGFTYLFAIKAKFKKMDFSQAIAFGLGFGGAEAFVLGLISFLNISVLLSFPQLIDVLPPGQRVALLEQLTLPTITVLAPIIERVFTIFIHIFCALLVIKAVKSGRFEFFMYSFLFKTLADGMLPMATLTFNRSTVLGIYSIEMLVVALGAFSILGTFLLKKRFGKSYRVKTKKRMKIIYLSAATALVIIISLLFSQANTASPIERRTVNFEDFHGKFDFILNGEKIGYSEYEYVGSAGEGLYIIKEITNLSTPEYTMLIVGDLHVTIDARPVYYNMTIYKNGDVKNVINRFNNGVVSQTITENGNSQNFNAQVNPDAFIIANNMISHWSLLFLSSKLEQKNTYIAHVYSPNIAQQLTIPLKVEGVEEVKIDGQTYEAYIFSDARGNKNYVTPAGELLLIENHVLDIVRSRGKKLENAPLFR